MDQKIVQRNIKPETLLRKVFKQPIAEFRMNAQIFRIVGNCVDRAMTSV